MSQIPCLLVLCTCPDRAVALDLGRLLVAEDLAACVNLIPELTSVFRWEERVETQTECLLLIKTTEARYPSLERRLQDAHPYQVPEIIAVPLKAGSPAYLAWLAGAVAGSGREDQQAGKRA